MEISCCFKFYLVDFYRDFIAVVAPCVRQGCVTWWMCVIETDGLENTLNWRVTVITINSRQDGKESNLAMSKSLVLVDGVLDLVLDGTGHVSGAFTSVATAFRVVCWEWCSRQLVPFIYAFVVILESLLRLVAVRIGRRLFGVVSLGSRVGARCEQRIGWDEPCSSQGYS
jgi:hypothetical protein